MCSWYLVGASLKLPSCFSALLLSSSFPVLPSPKVRIPQDKLSFDKSERPRHSVSSSLGNTHTASHLSSPRPQHMMLAGDSGRLDVQVTKYGSYSRLEKPSTELCLPSSSPCWTAVVHGAGERVSSKPFSMTTPMSLFYPSRHKALRGNTALFLSQWRCEPPHFSPTVFSVFPLNSTHFLPLSNYQIPSTPSVHPDLGSF